jgi:hypothetical protein
MPTFVEIKELWAFGLFVLLVKLQAYHLYCILFMANLKALPRIDSMDFMVVKNWRGLDYKEQMFDWARQFGGYEKKLIVFLKFCVFWGESWALDLSVCNQFHVLCGWGWRMLHCNWLTFHYSYIILLHYEL